MPSTSRVRLVRPRSQCFSRRHILARARPGHVLVSDMPKAIGGGGATPTPGWFLRAALANCDATAIAMRAAQRGLVLSALEVTVDSQADDRGLLGLRGAGVLPGPTSMRVRIAAEGVPA